MGGKDKFKDITQVSGVKWDTNGDVFQIDVQAKIVQESKEPVIKCFFFYWNWSLRFTILLDYSLQLQSLWKYYSKIHGWVGFNVMNYYNRNTTAEQLDKWIATPEW